MVAWEVVGSRRGVAINSSKVGPIREGFELRPQVEDASMIRFLSLGNAFTVLF